MSIKDRLIQYVFRGKNELSPEAKKIAEDLDKVRNAGKELTEELDKAKGAQGLAVSLRGASEASERARTTLERTEKRAADLREELNQNPGSKGLADSLRVAEREAARAARELDKLTAETKRAEEAAQAAGIDTSKLADEEQRLASEVERAKTAVTENTKQLRALERQQRAASRAAAEHKSRVDAARESMARGAKQVLGFAAAYLSLRSAMRLAQSGLNLVRDGIRSMLDTGSEFELMQQRVTGLMGSIEAGEQATAWISQFAKETGQLIPDVTEAFALLKAYGLDPMDGSLKAITDKSVQLGGGMERLSGITAALGQMWAKEKIQQEEVLQLTERGVVVWPLLEKAMGKTTAQLQDMAQKGQLGRDAVKLLIDEIGRSADGAAAAGLDTLQGKMNGLRNSVSEFFNRISESGAMDAVKERLSALADQIDRMDEDGTLDNLAQALSAAFVQGIEKIEEFARSLGHVDFKQLADASAEWLRDFGAKIDSAVEMGQMAGRIFTGVWHGFRTMVTGAATALVAATNMTLGSLARYGEKIADAVGLDSLAEKMRHTHELISALQDAFADATVESANKVAAAIEGSNKRVTASYRSMLESAKSAVSDLGDVYRNNISSLGNALAAIELTPTLEKLSGLEAAIQKAFDAGNLNEKERTQALEALSQRKADLGDVTEQTAIKIRELTRAIEDEKNKQAEALEERLKGNISLEEFAQRHNESAEAIVRLAQAAEEAAKPQDELAKTVESLKKEQAELFAEYRKGNITLEDYQKRHNALAEEISKLGGAATNAKRGIDEVVKGLKTFADWQDAIKGAETDVDIRKLEAALTKMYTSGDATAEEYRKGLAELEEQKIKVRAATDDQAKSERGLAGSIEQVASALEKKKAAEAQAQQEADAAAAQRAREMNAWGAYFDAVMSAAREPLAAMSEQALAAFDSLHGITNADMSIDTSGIEATRASMERLRESMAITQRELDTGWRGPFAKWASERIQQSQQIQQSYLQQKLSLQKLMEAYDSGSITLQGFRNQAANIRNSLTLLDATDLNQLDSALASIDQRMKSVGDSARSTLDSVRDELDRLRGDEEAIEQRRMASRRRDLQAQLAEARAAGNSQAASDLSKAIGMLSTIESEQRLAREEEARKNRREAQAAQAPGAQQASTTAPTPPATVIRLETTRGQAVDLSVAAGQEQALLGILEQAGLRSI